MALLAAASSSSYQLLQPQTGCGRDTKAGPLLGHWDPADGGLWLKGTPTPMALWTLFLTSSLPSILLPSVRHQLYPAESPFILTDDPPQKTLDCFTLSVALSSGDPDERKLTKKKKYRFSRQRTMSLLGCILVQKGWKIRTPTWISGLRTQELSSVRN